MTLAALRLRGALRSLTARPLWLATAISLLAGALFGGYRLVLAGVTWLLDYPLIGSIAPAVIQRSLEAFFLMLMAAVLFSVLIASIGILYGSDDLELLLGQPVSSARIFAIKTGELFVNAAGLPLAFTLPVLLAVGRAVDAHFLYYPASILAAVSLYALPVTSGSLLALVLVRFSPAGRVREVATGVSVAAAAAAVLGFRMLRPEKLATITALGPEEFEAALAAFTRLEIGWLPPAWATTASWAAAGGEVHASLLALLLVGACGLLLTGVLARLAYTRGWVRSLDSVPPRRLRAIRSVPAWERLLRLRLGVVGVILAKDARVFLRDVQQWSQVLVLLALGGVYFVSLAAVPVPNQQFRDALGAVNIGFAGFLLAGVALRVVYPSVSYEGAAYWLTRVNPVRVRDLVAARFLFNLPIMLLLGLGLGLAAALVLDLSPVLALAAPVAATCMAIAITGLAVGMGAANPRFHFTNPNELVMTPGALAFMTLATGHAALTVILFARPAWMAMRGSGDASYWLAPEGLLVLALLLLLTLAVTLLPLVEGARRLQESEH
jgi:ABC-2 type transport system permease protein